MKARNARDINSSGGMSFIKRFIFIAAGLLLVSTISIFNVYPGTRTQDERMVSVGTPKLRQKDEIRSTIGSTYFFLNASQHETHEGIDVVIAGFPKCGTSTLLFSFEDNDEMEMPHQEYCVLSRKDKSRAMAIARMRMMMHSTYSQQSINQRGLIKGIKCPTSIRNAKSLQLLEQLNPETKVIVGLRHPVLFFQSYYNFWVLAINSNRKYMFKNITAPDPNTLIGDEKIGWRGIYTDLARYEDSLMQLGKVDLTREELQHMASQRLHLFPVDLKIFLYDVEQLSDSNEFRSRKFRSDMQFFLGLKKTIEPFARRNAISNKKSYPETINICEKKFSELRGVLVKHGKKAQKWILEKLLKNKDVFVGGDRDHFSAVLFKWGTDPCPSPTEANKKEP